MTTTEAQKKASIKYAKNNLKRIPIDVKPEQKERYEAAAQSAGQSLRSFILDAVEERILLESELDEVGKFYQKKLLEYKKS